MRAQRHSPPASFTPRHTARAYVPHLHVPSTADRSGFRRAFVRKTFTESPVPFVPSHKPLTAHPLHWTFFVDCSQHFLPNEPHWPHTLFIRHFLSSAVNIFCRMNPTTHPSPVSHHSSILCRTSAVIRSAPTAAKQLLTSNFVHSAPRRGGASCGLFFFVSPCVSGSLSPNSPFTTLHSLFAIRYSPFTSRHSLFAIRYSPFLRPTS